jgi:hypothetical protein
MAMAAGQRRRRGPLLAALTVLALAGAATTFLVRLDRARIAERAAADARAAALRAADGIRSLLGGIEVQTQNATANPRLVAALDANVDEETLRDLLLTETWWEPFRSGVDGFGLYADEATRLVSSHLDPSLDPRTLVREARQGHHAASDLVVADDQVLAVTACPVALAGRTAWPVLLATKQIDAALLAGVAARAGATVAISDGRRLLVSATATDTNVPDLSTLRQALELSPLATARVAASPLTSGLRVLAEVPLPALVSSATPLPGPALALLIAGIVFAGGLYLMLARAGATRTGEIRVPTTTAATTPVAAPRTEPSAGRYTIVERIGRGGMADVYAALTTGEGSFRRPVVIKRLRPELASDPNAVARFCDEANLLAALNHPNIVAVYDFGRVSGQYFLAEEYIVGRDLGRLVARRFERGAGMPTEAIAYVACEILKALDYAHGLTNEQGRPLGIVHRDISPENVMVTARGEVKLLDFGVVKASEGRTAKTEIGIVKGNVNYMAPEQARGLDVDARADLFGLALVLFDCCTGRPLYAHDTTYGLLMMAGAGPAAEERAAIAALPAPFAAVIARATAERIEDRYPDARAMARDLEAHAGSAGSGRASTAALVAEMFGAELRDESQRLQTFASEVSARPVAGYPS